jgi:hypothetical protein
LKILTAFAEIGCKVTHFLSLTQIFLRKSAPELHTWGISVQKNGPFLPIYSYKKKKLTKNYTIRWLFKKDSVALRNKSKNDG